MKRKHKLPKAVFHRAEALMRKGHDKGSAYAIAVSASQKEGRLKPGSVKLTPKGRSWDRKHREEKRASLVKMAAGAASPTLAAQAPVQRSAIGRPVANIDETTGMRKIDSLKPKIGPSTAQQNQNQATVAANAKAKQSLVTKASKPPVGKSMLPVLKTQTMYNSARPGTLR